MQVSNTAALKILHIFLVGSLSVLLSVLISHADSLTIVAAAGAGFLAAALIWYRKLSLPVLVATFFWAGLQVPGSTVAETGRWAILGLAAAAGLLHWRGEQSGFRVGYLHFFAAATAATFMLSFDVSSNPGMTVLKAGSVALLFLYCSTGALVFVAGREKYFLRGITLACEALIYASAISYGVLRFPVFGNPNSLGAVMGVVAWPIMFWSCLTIRTRIGLYRNWSALIICGGLLFLSLARAGILAAAISSVLILFALRRKRLMLAWTLGGCLCAIAMPSFLPDQWQAMLNGVVYKSKPGLDILQSRRPRWDQTIDEIRARPWLGSGFGAAKDISEEWKGGVATRGLNRERGSSYLGLAAGVGLLGAVPAAFLLGLIVARVRTACRRVRLARLPLDASIPIAGVITAGLCHAGFEDWLFAPGYYLTVIFWIMVFVLASREDTFLHAPAGADSDVRSPRHKTGQRPHAAGGGQSCLQAG